jgi:uncharacterized membrane protein YbhN (UPF0104 family)
MKRLAWIRHVVLLGAGLALAGYIGYYLFERRGEFGRALELRPEVLALLAGLVLVGLALRAWQFQMMVRVVGAGISYGRAAQLILAGLVMNLVPLRFGTIMRAASLKRENQVRYASFASMHLGEVLVLVMSTGVLGLAGLLFGGAAGRAEATVLGGLFAGAIVVSAAVLHTPRAWVDERRTRVHRFLHGVLSGWETLRTARRALAVILLARVAGTLLGVWRLWLAFGSLGVEAGFFRCLILSAVMQLVLLVSFTPAGFGLRELVVAAAAVATGLTFEQGLFASTLDHAVALAVMLLAGVPSLVLLAARRRRSPGEAEEAGAAEAARRESGA